MRILDQLVEMVRVVHGSAGKVAQHDRDMAQQMKRACTSAALNASGLYAKAGKRRSRLEDAVNSARETHMALRLAGACEHLQPAEVAAAAREVESVIRVLWVLANRRCAPGRWRALARGEPRPRYPPIQTGVSRRHHAARFSGLRGGPAH